MVEWIHPGIIICLGGFLIPFIKPQKIKQAYFLLLPIAGLIILLFTSLGTFGTIPPWPQSLHKFNIPFLKYTLAVARINKLSMLFAYVYVIAAFCMNLYALSAKSDWEHVAAMIYVGSALGAIFAGDFFTLFFFLEIMSWAPFFLLLFRGTKRSGGAAIRYILWHHFSGVCLLAGILIHVHNVGSIEFVHMPWGWGGQYLGYNLMLLGFIVNAATAPFHSWLADTYSEASPSGSIYMTAYTTKTAVFCLIITFSGTELLMWMGTITALFAVIMAVLETDGRRMLSYHIISQVGYMVAGDMPLSFWLTIIGGFSISAFPIFSGFISKTMTIEAAELINKPIVYLMLEGASIGTFLSTTLKLPWNIWLQGRPEPPTEIRNKLKDSAVNTPLYMLVAMGILAFLSILLGVYPNILYQMLPYPVEFVPYTATRVFTITQLFIFTFLGFWILRKILRGHQTYTLDTDWFVRIPGIWFLQFCKGPLISLGTMLDRNMLKLTHWMVASITNPRLESAMTPRAIGLGIFIILILFSLFLVSKI
jgi:multicomponent Na+:H+ antiporter subunit D